MAKSIIEFVVGDLEEKRTYRKLMRRVNALPKDYRFAFKKMQHYLYNFDAVGCDMTVFVCLLDLLEASAAEGRTVLEVTGGDVAAFCDELLKASAADTLTVQKNLNKEILEHFNRKEK